MGVSGFRIRVMEEADRDIWAGMYLHLYAQERLAGIHAEITRILRHPDRLGVVAEAGGDPLGFAEWSLRPFANGCRAQPVPFLEAIWVDPAHRRAGVARALVAYLEDHARGLGYREMGSDVLQDNLTGLDLHRELGFSQTERVVFFRKDL